LIEIEGGDLDEPVSGHVEFEHHLSLRLAGGAAEGWAMRFPIGTVGAASEKLGASLLFGKRMAQRDFSARDLAAATDTGFALLDAGPKAIVAFFEGLRAEVGSPQNRPPARHGRNYDWMARGHGASAAFSPLRDVLRTHIFDNWPLDEGELALEYRLPARRLHSIRSASQAQDLHPKRLRRLLVDAGIIAETGMLDCDMRSARLRQGCFSIKHRSVSFTQAQRRLGMTRTQMERLTFERFTRLQCLFKTFRNERRLRA